MGSLPGGAPPPLRERKRCIPQRLIAHMGVVAERRLHGGVARHALHHVDGWGRPYLVRTLQDPAG